MISLTFLNNYAPIFLMIVLIVLIYGGLKLLKIPGNNSVLALVSFLLSFMIVSSSSVNNYLINLTPYILMLLFIGFLIFMVFSLVMGKLEDLGNFRKIMLWTFFIIAIIISISLAFSHFDTLNNMLPDSSDEGLNDGLIKFKNFIYSQTFKDSAVFIIAMVIVGFFLLKK